MRYHYNDDRHEIARMVRKLIENGETVIVQIYSCSNVNYNMQKKTYCKVQDYEFGSILGYGYKEKVRLLEELFNMMFLKELFIFFKTVDYKYVGTHNHFCDIDNLVQAFNTFHYSVEIVETHESLYILLRKVSVKNNVYISRESEADNEARQTMFVSCGLPTCQE